MFKRQQFENSKSDTTKLRISKRPHIDEHNNEEGKVQKNIRIKVIDMLPFFFVSKRSQTAQKIWIRK